MSCPSCSETRIYFDDLGQPRLGDYLINFCTTCGANLKDYQEMMRAKDMVLKELAVHTGRGEIVQNGEMPSWKDYDRARIKWLTRPKPPKN